MPVPLETLFDESQQQYEPIRTRTRAQVASWVWATGPLPPVLPLWFERTRLKPGKVMDGEPSACKNVYAYGFSADHALLVKEQYTGIEGQCYEEFYVYTADSCEGWRFSNFASKELVNVTRRTDSAENATRFETYTAISRSEEFYTRIGGRVTEIRVRQQEHGKDWIETVFTATYDTYGELQALAKRYANGKTEDVVRKPAATYSEKDLRRLILTRLPKTVIDLIAGAKIGDAAYCVVLAYGPDDVGPILPPILGVGLEKERVAFRASHGERVKDLLWNPAEFNNYDTPALALTEPELIRACDDYRAMLAQRSASQDARKLLCEVAAQLAAMDWTGRLNVTADFAVFAVDFEGTDLKKNLTASVAAPLRKLFV